MQWPVLQVCCCVSFDVLSDNCSPSGRRNSFGPQWQVAGKKRHINCQIGSKNMLLKKNKVFTPLSWNLKFKKKRKEISLVFLYPLVVYSRWCRYLCTNAMQLFLLKVITKFIRQSKHCSPLSFLILFHFCFICHLLCMVLFHLFSFILFHLADVWDFFVKLIFFIEEEKLFSKCNIMGIDRGVANANWAT